MAQFEYKIGERPYEIWGAFRCFGIAGLGLCFYFRKGSNLPILRAGVLVVALLSIVWMVLHLIRYVNVA